MLTLRIFRELNDPGALNITCYPFLALVPEEFRARVSTYIERRQNTSPWRAEDNSKSPNGNAEISYSTEGSHMEDELKRMMLISFKRYLPEGRTLEI